MSVLSRSALEESPLADLHVIATELGIDGFRRLRKAELIDAILAVEGGGEEEGATDEGAGDAAEDGTTDEGASESTDSSEESSSSRPRRGRRGGRGRNRRDADEGAEGEGEPEADAEAEEDEPAEEDTSKAPRAESRRSESRGGDSSDKTADGVVELLGNGSGFVRVSPPDPSDDDVYISAAQVRRCELVSGDRVTGPVRAPRRSERYPSLIRVDTINGRPADEVAEGTHFDDLPCTFPTERFALLSEDPTLRSIEWLTPLGRGSRATLVGPARSGKSEALRRLATALNNQENLDVGVVLAGVRPEEVAEWREAGVEAAATITLGASSEGQAQAVDRAVETARRVAARGGDAVVLIDTLDGLAPHAARRALAAARNIVDGGSLTIIATSTAPVGGETTVIAFDADLTSTGRFPALNLGGSGTMRPELLVGQAGADAIAQARSAALS
jgi:transcription termination factor Rho